MSHVKTRATLVFAVVALLLLAGCIPNHQVQPKLNTYESTQFFPDRASARPQLADTVARTQGLRGDAAYTGKENGQPVTTIPIEVNDQLLARGQQRFGIYCTPCHGAEGKGDGIVVQRGYKQPPALTDPRLVSAPPGYIYDVITNGFGMMPPYNVQVQSHDRWAIAAYVKQHIQGVK